MKVVVVPSSVVCLLLVFVFAQIAFGQPTKARARRPVPRLLMEEERESDPPASRVWRLGSSRGKVVSYNNFTSYQVNVDAGGNNIVGDAANEPSIAVNPLNGAQMSIGWRQFNSVKSNFRQGGFAYTTNGGTSWTFPHSLTSGFRSDPVLTADASGKFLYLSLVPNFFDDLWFSGNGGQSYSRIGPALGGDKQWFTSDNTSGPGHGYLYQFWSAAGNNYDGRQFTRSVNFGASWMDPIDIPSQPSDGTLDVDSSGNLYIGGANFNDLSFWCVRSTDAKNAAVIPTFDQVTPVDLGGYFDGFNVINPVGLTGQVYIGVDRSGTSTNNNVYMLASVVPYDLGGGADVMFARSADGGASFNSPRRINDDPINPNKWHWLAALAVAPNGRIDVVWLDTRNAANDSDSQLFYSYSLDGGASWSVNVAVSPPFDPYLGYPNQEKMGDYISIVSDSTGANVAYCATFNSEQDIYYVRVAPAPAVLVVRSITRGPGGVTVTFASVVGKTYRCDYSDSPAGPWQQLQRGIAGTGGDVPVLDPATANVLKRFYRVVQLP